MEVQRSLGAFLRSLLLLLVVAIYVLGLVVWTPLFLIWPRRYAGLTYLQTVWTYWVLVRHIWTNLVRKAP